MIELDISPDNPSAPDVAKLLKDHLLFAQEWSLLEDVDVLNVEELFAENIFFFSARRRGELVAIGALRHLDPEHAEIKSMHTAAGARGQGCGKVMLEHLVRSARDRGYLRVSLETGLEEAFAPARSLYLKYGFEVCQPFGDYQAKADSVCMTLRLTF